MPLMKLNTTPVTRSQPPQRIRLARVRPVRDLTSALAYVGGAEHAKTDLLLYKAAG